MTVIPCRAIEIRGEGTAVTDKPDNASRVDPKLLEILVCPLTKGPLRYDAQNQELISERAGLAYPIRDGIPIMLVDEARQTDGREETAER
jgi:uncharacterized protein YbaR (Trm112 family)